MSSFIIFKMVINLFIYSFVAAFIELFEMRSTYQN